jgi:hypothetical protein
MFVESVSNQRVRLGSLTNTQGMPPTPAHYIAFAELKHRTSRSLALQEVHYEVHIRR